LSRVTLNYFLASSLRDDDRSFEVDESHIGGHGGKGREPQSILARTSQHHAICINAHDACSGGESDNSTPLVLPLRPAFFPRTIGQRGGTRLGGVGETFGKRSNPRDARGQTFANSQYQTISNCRIRVSTASFRMNRLYIRRCIAIDNPFK